ncbi:uncharacterized protein CcaverHIS019_0403450 [Cutaneotrichosporon cavernicola]|uniref:J domain-containing protein n=1 Tax=Cutaneotrichosporon cavernicola TaxID=279322 RepID=A0AA48L3Z3_9TREE|nr:uncharacterized protein CcaverHIS019_0403450 [Cutaneotrichosporon cavernicola]BEI91525.1 hypothetical protein CcaverHIS019_0403450 [Cutaneotrichosporon cavernicola]
MRPPSLLRCSRCWRGLSTSVSLSARHQDHYAVLKLPHNATKAQIKARFYELSKKTHPDAPGGSSTAFHTINDAYAVLGDDAQRVAYDRQHVPRASGSGVGAGFHPHSPQARRAAGPHRAWEGGPMGDGRGTWGKAAPGPAWTGRRKVDPNLGWGMGMGGSSGHNSTGDLGGMRWGKKESPREKANREKRFGAARRKEEIEGESTGVRLLVVVILLFCIMGIGGGFSTSSAEVEEELD